MSAEARSVFSNRSFSLFYVGQTFSYAGDGLRIIALPLLVYHLTGSALSIGVTYALEMGPFALFGLVGGSLADRLDRRRLMIACDFIRFATMALFAFGYARGLLTLPLLYTGIAVISTSAAIFLGAQASTIPYLLGKARATQAVAALLSAEQATQMVLPPVGGALFALMGPLPALVINATTYMFSQISLAAVDTFGPDAPLGVPSIRELLADVATGFRFLWRDRSMAVISFVLLSVNFFGFLGIAVMVPFLKRDLNATDAAVGYTLGCGAVGAVVGSYLGGRAPRTWPFGRMLIVAFLVDGVTFVPITFAHTLWVAVPFLALANAAALFEVTQIVGWRMRVTPEELVGRVFGAARLVVLAGTVPGAVIGGYIGDRYGARDAIAVSTAGYIVASLVLACIPAVRNERR